MENAQLFAQRAYGYVGKQTDRPNSITDECVTININHQVIKRLICILRDHPKYSMTDRYSEFISDMIDKIIMNKTTLKGLYIPKVTKSFFVISPNGEIIIVSNQSKFCKDNNLDSTSFSRMLNGKRKSSQGWTKYIPNKEI
jgi:hypothetical protein